MYFEPMQFINNLSYMGFGMLGVFMIIGVIIAATYAINAFFSRSKKDKNE